jgi:uncharacterized protein (TIGR00255 family)
MTGFGMAEGTVGGKRVSVEVRTVNHRFFNPSIKLPAAFSQWEGDVREALRRRIARGHVTVQVRYDSGPDGGATIDARRFAQYVEQLRELRERHVLRGDVELDTVLRMPGLFASPDELGDGSAAELVGLVEEAANALAAMREQEGSRLAGVIDERVTVLQGALDRIAERAPTRLMEQRDRLRLAVKELMDGMEVDEPRLAQELAILASKLDVSEEVDRFRSHIAAFRNALRAGDSEPVGKRLGFLLQEMLREANTTGSKANDAPILGDVVSIKEELERIREQVENLE